MKNIIYEKCSDEQLAALIKSGDYAPFGELLNRYMPHIVSSASKYKSVIEAEDLESEGILALFMASKSYQPEKSSFRTFAYLCIERGILAQFRYIKALKRIPSEMIQSIDGLGLAGGKNPENMFIEKEKARIFFDSVKNELSEFEYAVLREFISGKSYKEIAEYTGTTAKAVDNALRRVREKLSKLKLTRVETRNK